MTSQSGRPEAPAARPRVPLSLLSRLWRDLICRHARVIGVVPDDERSAERNGPRGRPPGAPFEN
jgi:hypothetical protein